jgi:tripartite-type tricarboxylate transporter receptor subunit TctC
MKLPRRQFLHLAAGAAAFPVVSRIAKAETYPSRPVRIIVAAAAGGTTDITARLIGQWLSERLGQAFLVENRPGGNSNIGTEAAVRASPDGYTLLMVTTTAAINASLYERLSYNFISDIAPVARISDTPLVMVVHPLFPAKTVPEFLAYAKANPGKLNLGSAGAGTVVHVSGELFKMMTGVKLEQVQYRGGAPAVADLLGGQIKKFEISLRHSDIALPIFRRANTGAMRFANLRLIRRWKAGGGYPESRTATQTS